VSIRPGGTGRRGGSAKDNVLCQSGMKAGIAGMFCPHSSLGKLARATSIVVETIPAARQELRTSMVRCEKRAEPRQLGPIVVQAAVFARVDRNDRTEMSRTQTPEMKISERVAVALNRLPQVFRHATIRVHIEQMAPVSRIKPKDQLQSRRLRLCRRAGPSKAIRTQTQVTPAITNTETAASAITWTTAARMLLSRAALPCACSCSSKRTVCTSSPIRTCAVKACGSGISSTDSR